MALLTVEGLVFDYPGNRALHGVSFTLEPGAITALVGPNGAGKTTLMRCLAALERPSAGRVVIEGVDLSEDPRHCHRFLGYLSDFFGVYEQLTVRRCLLYRGLSQGMTMAEAEKATLKAAERVGLSDRLDQAAGTLSRGLRQRLGIAQAILHDPRFVILDEPASGLDPEARDDLSSLLRGLRDDGMTFLVSSHILAELSDYATEMLLLSDGRLIEHRRVEDDEGEAAGTVTLQITLSEPKENFGDLLQGLLAEQAGAVVRGADTLSALVRIPADQQARHALLAGLLAADCKVSEFAVREADLQSLYRERLVRERAGESSKEVRS